MSYRIFFVAIFLIIVGAAQTQWYMQDNPNFLTEENIGDQILDSHFTKVVHFMEPECHYCPQIKPHLDRLSKQLQENSQISTKFYQLDCQKNQQLCADFRITKMPYLIVFNKQGRVIQQLPGQRQSCRFTVQKIQQALATIQLRSYQENRIALLKHIRSQGHGKQQLQLPNKIQEPKQKQQQDIRNLKLKVPNKQQKLLKNNEKNTTEQRNSSSICSQKIDIQNLLPHQSRAKIVQEVLITRQRRDTENKLKLTSKIGMVLIMLIIVGLVIYLKQVILNYINYVLNRKNCCPQQFDNSEKRK